jgi:nicotinamidase-related amidase
VTKGSNPWTEHYSAVQADVPDPADVTTQLNTGLIKTLEEADIILVAGEAGSHCLANTVRDIANNFGDASYVGKLVLLEDATSPVPTFDKFQDDFVAEMTAKGMQLSTTVDWMS